MAAIAIKKEVVEQHVAELGTLHQKADATAEQIGEYRTIIADVTQKQAAAAARRASVEQAATSADAACINYAQQCVADLFWTQGLRPPAAGCPGALGQAGVRH